MRSLHSQRVAGGRQCASAAPCPRQQRPFIGQGAARSFASRAATPSEGAVATFQPGRGGETGKAKVLDLVSKGFNNYSAGDVFAEPVAQLIKENPTPLPGNESIPLGQGVWQVFYAPHIAKISSLMGTTFDPIRYSLSGTTLTSNVQYSNALLGKGWLSAGGSMSRKYDDSVEVHFDRFWVDGGETLRPDISAGAESSVMVDDIIGAIGRAAFFPQLAIFPVLYLDRDICVFKFTPLNSVIAVCRVGDA